MAQKDGLEASERALGWARMACDAKRNRAKTVQ
jgi:hypothetical protein